MTYPQYGDPPCRDRQHPPAAVFLPVRIVQEKTRCSAYSISWQTFSLSLCRLNSWSEHIKTLVSHPDKHTLSNDRAMQLPIHP